MFPNHDAQLQILSIIVSGIARNSWNGIMTVTESGAGVTGMFSSGSNVTMTNNGTISMSSGAGVDADGIQINDTGAIIELSILKR